MKLTKQQLLQLDELKCLPGFNLLKEIIEDKKQQILRGLTNIRSYETTNSEIKVIHSADNQLNEIRGRLQEMDSIIKLIETAYSKSKE